MPPTASIILDVVTTTLAAGLNKAQGLIAKFGKTVAMAPVNVGAHLGKEIGRGVLRDLTYRGMDFLVDQGRDLFKFQDALTRFGIAARIAGPELVGVGDAIRRVSTDTGVNANEVLRGARAYVDLAGAGAYTTEKMSLIARAAQASGSDINDMATVVYALQHSMSIPNTQLEDTIGGLINLSKDGAVHFNQMAQELVSLAPVYAQFGVTGRQGAIELAAQLEVVRTGFGSASEAGTGLLRLYRSIPQHAKLFEKAGVQIFKPGSRTELLTMGKILENIKKSSLEKDRPALIKAFGRGESERSYQLLDKLLGEYDKLEEAGHRNGVVQEDLAAYTQSSTGRMKVAYEELKNKVAEALTPQRIEQIVSGIEAMASAASGLGKALGAAGDVFSGLYNMAREARMFFSNTDDVQVNNPWYIAPHTDKYDAREKRINNPEPTDASYEAARLAKEQKANAEQYDYRARQLIGLTGGPDMPANKEAIRQALLDTQGKFVDASGRVLSYGANDPGAAGSKLAGQRYLDQAPKQMVQDAAAELAMRQLKPTIDAIGKAVGDAVTSAMKEHPSDHALALARYKELYGKDYVEVKVDGNPIARAGSNASDRRRK